MGKSKFKRVILKVSGEALAGNNGFGFDFNVVEKILITCSVYSQS